MRYRLPIGVILLIVLLFGCALPEPEGPEQEFVPDREIQVVSLTREGLAYAKRSRLVDAELKLRQAVQYNAESGGCAESPGAEQ